MSKKPRRTPKRVGSKAAADDPAAQAIGRRAARFRVVSWLCLCGGLVGMFLFGGEWLAERRVLKEGIAAPAKIVGLTKLTKGREATYKLTLSYDREDPPKGEPPTVRQDFEVDEATYKAARGDGPLTIRYLPDQPESARLAGMPSQQPLKIAMAGVVAAIGAVLAWFAFRRRPAA